MSVWVIQNPPRMPDIRLQAIHAGKSETRSVLIYGGVYIRKLDLPVYGCSLLKSGPFAENALEALTYPMPVPFV